MDAVEQKLFGLKPDEDISDAQQSSGDASGADDSPGRVRRRKSAKKQGTKISSDLRFRLLEEQSAPFRRFRQFFYFAAGGSASLGTLIAGARVVAGLNGVPGTQPLSETVPNTAINAGVVAVSLGLYLWEEGRGQATMKTMSEKSGVREQLAQLPLELSTGAEVELRELRDETRAVILMGRASEVTRCINLAARAGPDLVRNDVTIVPVFTDLADDSAGWEAMKESSERGQWDPWLARPKNRSAWKEWQRSDRQTMAAKNKDSGAVDKDGKDDRLLRVYIIRKDGKIGARTVGPPAWPKLVKQIEALPLSDEYGTP